MRDVKTPKGLLNPGLNIFGSSHVASGRYGCASGMLQAFKHRDLDQACADLFQTVKL